MPILRGALIEYGSGLIGPIPNVVIFQFNPETMTRTMQVPERPAASNDRENSQAGDRVYETVSFKALFAAADLLNDDKVLARAFGIGPQLAALEKMVNASSLLAGKIGEALDKIGGALGIGGSDSGGASQPIPREKYPKVLFIWGLTRIVPVTINAMRISELEYDALLNPTRAEVEIEVGIHPTDPCAKDSLAEGALMYSTMAKEAMAMANLANTVEQVVELIPF